MEKRKKAKNFAIISLGVQLTATMKQMNAICLGHVGDLRPLEGVVEKSNSFDGTVFIKTRESAPLFNKYPADFLAVIRFTDDHVLNQNGLYDLYAMPAEVASKKLSTPADLTIPHQSASDLLPILGSASEIRPYIMAAEPNRKVIMVTDDMINTIVPDGFDEKGAFILVRDKWDLDSHSPLTRIYAGDFFLVSNAYLNLGYRIGEDEFFETHTLSCC